MMQTQTETVRKTRAEVYRDMVKIRLATDDAGPEIARVLKANNIEFPGADWSKVFPHWLIATVNDQVIGCVMVMTGKPVGFLEFLFVDPKASFKLRAVAIRKLLLQGAATIRLYGATTLCCIVHWKNEKFSGVLGKIGFVQVAPHMMMMRNLAG